ncbi:MAG: 4-hydroxy-3-methylbut-2-enyl diphosphate reductase [Pedosphaera sp.]|nr:4-hydroxy-3-methylbut-2-enyl diphosphate reductase [Pedosphaera sp.]
MNESIKILRAEHLGMCFGVRDAIRLATRQAEAGPVTILGELVHNERVLRHLRERGVQFATDLNQVATATLLITAHGASEVRINAARATGRTVLEATCPLVHVAHAALKKLVLEGFHPVIIGQRQHIEVRGMTEDLEVYDVVLTEADIDQLGEYKRLGVVSQTTQHIEKVRHLVARLRSRFPQSEIRFRDTVCQPTKLRQQAAETLASKCSVVIVIGGLHSNNTRELVTTCRKHCQRVHHIQAAADIQPSWFELGETVGLTAGTSTTDEAVNEVENALRAIAKQKSAKDQFAIY